MCQRWTKLITFFFLVCVIGLDPAGPMFILSSSTRQYGLNSSCANFVEVLHTSTSLGTTDRLGHVDFYANRNAANQPGCEDSGMQCNHDRANEIYYASCFPEFKFIGKACADSSSTGSSVYGYFNTEHKHGCYEFRASGCFGYSLK